MINTLKDEKGNLAADFGSILATWRNSFSQVLNVQGGSNMTGTNCDLFTHK
jgi:hypothetical protein